MPVAFILADGLGPQALLPIGTYRLGQDRAEPLIKRETRTDLSLLTEQAWPAECRGNDNAIFAS